jgi:hypothetical protein
MKNVKKVISGLPHGSVALKVKEIQERLVEIFDALEEKRYAYAQEKVNLLRGLIGNCDKLQYAASMLDLARVMGKFTENQEVK